jgi:HAD superfamily phosphoserine phosphatase-like hydrolase
MNLDEVIKFEGKKVFENSEILEKQNKNASQNLMPGIIALDADGTIINGDHWFTLIDYLPEDARNRIKSRAKLLSKSTITFEQQYFSAASLYEFALEGWDENKILEIVKEIVLREGVVQLIEELQQKGFVIVVISHGIKQVLQEVLKNYKLDGIEVVGNNFVPQIISPLIEGFIPEFIDLPDESKNPIEFVNFVKTMNVVPNYKGQLLSNLFHKYEGKNNIAVGDSLGDLEMFKQMIQSNGKTILHVHPVGPNKFAAYSDQIERFRDNVGYFSVNTVDTDFEPTIELIYRLCECKE